MTQEQIDNLKVGDVIHRTTGTVGPCTVADYDGTTVILEHEHNQFITVLKAGLLGDDYIIKQTENKDKKAETKSKKKERPDEESGKCGNECKEVMVSGYRYFMDPLPHTEIYFLDGSGISLSAKQMVQMYEILKKHVV